MAISVSFTVIPSTDVDPDSPITTNLMQAIVDNSLFNNEWLGDRTNALANHAHAGLAVDGTKVLSEAAITYMHASSEQFGVGFPFSTNSTSFTTIYSFRSEVPLGCSFYHRLDLVSATGGGFTAEFRLQATADGGAGATITGATTSTASATGVLLYIDSGDLSAVYPGFRTLFDLQARRVGGGVLDTAQLNSATANMQFFDTNAVGGTLGGLT